jgi:hypothetical protein
MCFAAVASNLEYTQMSAAQNQPAAELQNTTAQLFHWLNALLGSPWRTEFLQT